MDFAGMNDSTTSRKYERMGAVCLPKDGCPLPTAEEARLENSLDGGKKDEGS